MRQARSISSLHNIQPRRKKQHTRIHTDYREVKNQTTPPTECPQKLKLTLKYTPSQKPIQFCHSCVVCVFNQTIPIPKSDTKPECRQSVCKKKKRTENGARITQTHADASAKISCEQEQVRLYCVSVCVVCVTVCDFPRVFVVQTQHNYPATPSTIRACPALPALPAYNV